MITLDDEISAVKREIGYRCRVYPRFVAEKKMFQVDADRQIALMQAVLQRLEAIRDERSPGLPGLMPPADSVRRRG